MILKFDQLIVFLKTNTILTIDIKTLNNMVCLVKLDTLKSAEELQEILSRQTAIVSLFKSTGIRADS